MTDNPHAAADAEKAVAALATHTEQVHEIEKLLEELAPEAMQALRESRALIPELQDKAKIALRNLGPGRHNILGHAITVGSPPQSSSIDTEALITLAENRGDLPLLIKHGVLVYAVQAHQIPRLPDVEAAVYSALIHRTTGTPSVTLPPTLK